MYAVGENIIDALKMWKKIRCNIELLFIAPCKVTASNLPCFIFGDSSRFRQKRATNGDKCHNSEVLKQCTKLIQKLKQRD